MIRYLVIHSPDEDREGEVRPPTNMSGLVEAHGREGANPRWLMTWSPDLSDDRIFSLWEASSATEIRQVLDEFGFLDTMQYEALPVRQWGPDDVSSSGTI